MHDEKKQRTYIITGASSDVTIHFLERLGSQISDDRKIKIFAQYRTSSKTLQNLAARYHNLDMDIRQCDLSIEKDTERWITYIKEVCISDDIVPTHIVHLAAPKFSYMRIRQLEWERFTNGMDVSVRSFALLLKEFLPMMSKAKFGRIVAMLTAYTIGIPPKFMSDYVTIKYALLGLIRAAAAEYAGKGITINGLSPNMMETKFLSNVDDRTVEITANSSAMRRNITLDETCAALEYILSDEAGYMQGINLNLSGGDRV